MDGWEGALEGFPFWFPLFGPFYSRLGWAAGLCVRYEDLRCFFSLHMKGSGTLDKKVVFVFGDCFRLFVLLEKNWISLVFEGHESLVCFCLFG